MVNEKNYSPQQEDVEEYLGNNGTSDSSLSTDEEELDFPGSSTEVDGSVADNLAQSDDIKPRSLETITDLRNSHDVGQKNHCGEMTPNNCDSKSKHVGDENDDRKLVEQDFPSSN